MGIDNPFPVYKCTDEGYDKENSEECWADLLVRLNDYCYFDKEWVCPEPEEDPEEVVELVVYFTYRSYANAAENNRRAYRLSCRYQSTFIQFRT